MQWKAEEQGQVLRNTSLMHRSKIGSSLLNIYYAPDTEVPSSHCKLPIIHSWRNSGLERLNSLAKIALQNHHSSYSSSVSLALDAVFKQLNVSTPLLLTTILWAKVLPLAPFYSWEVWPQKARKDLFTKSPSYQIIHCSTLSSGSHCLCRRRNNPDCLWSTRHGAPSRSGKTNALTGGGCFSASCAGTDMCAGWGPTGQGNGIQMAWLCT